MALSSQRADDEFVYVHWRAQQEEPAVHRQLSAVRQDLMVFSPGSEPTVTADGLPPSNGVDLTSELHFQDLLLKRALEVKAMQETNANLKKKLAAQQKQNKTVEIYQRALERISAEYECQRSQLAATVSSLTAERDEARDEVSNIETMFADLHRKYEKSKALLQEHRVGDDQQQTFLQEALEQMHRERQRYDMLKEYAEDAMQRLRGEMETATKVKDTELLRLTTKLQLSENQTKKLESQNQEITAICDELIQKIGEPQ